MHIENIGILASALDLVEKQIPEKFDLREWGTYMGEVLEKYSEEDLLTRLFLCGGPGCIAGWTKFLFDDGAGEEGTADFAARCLGLDIRQAYQLFTPFEAVLNDETGLVYEEITAGMAARVLRHLSSTGVVDWGQVEE